METSVNSVVRGFELDREMILYAIILLFIATVTLAVIGLNLLLIGAS